MSFSDKTTVDPLLKDLDEKKESFRRNVVSLASELKQVRGRLVSQEQSFLKETQTRKVNSLSLFFLLTNNQLFLFIINFFLVIFFRNDLVSFVVCLGSREESKKHGNGDV